MSRHNRVNAIAMNNLGVWLILAAMAVSLTLGIIILVLLQR